MSSPFASTSRSWATGDSGSPNRRGGPLSPKSLQFSPAKATQDLPQQQPVRFKGNSKQLGGGGRVVGTARAGRVNSLRAAWECVPFLVRWINYLCGGYLGWTKLTPENFFEDLKTGLVLCRLVERLIPNADFSVGLSMRPKTRKACITNLGNALAVVWQQSVKAYQMCSADDFYDGDVTKVTTCLLEIFDVLQMRSREVRLKARETVSCLQSVLSQVGRPLSGDTLVDPLGFSQSLLEDFADGARIISILIAVGKASPKDLTQLRNCCVLQEHWESNGVVINNALVKAGCPVLLSPKEWANPPPPSPDTFLFQLHVLWNFIRKDVDGTPKRHLHETKEEQMAQFFDFIHGFYPSIYDALVAMTPPRAIRASRTNFMKFVRQLGFPGDAKYIWDCLDKNSSGWVGFDEFRAFEHAVLSDIHHDSMILHSTMDSQMTMISPQLQRSNSEHSFSDQTDSQAGLLSPLQEYLEDSTFNAHDVPQNLQALQIRKIVDWAMPPDFQWPAPSLPRIIASVGGTSVRLPGYAEERTLMMADDERRQLELYETGAISVARRVASASVAAAKAAAEAAEAVEMSLPDLEQGEDLGPAPTSSIDARVLVSEDRSEKRMWLQTSVVDGSAGPERGMIGAPVANSPDAATTVLVLELRDFACDAADADAGNLLLRAQISLELITNVEQLSPTDSSSHSDVAFAVTFKPGADFMRPGPPKAKKIKKHKQMSPRDLREHNMAGQATQNSPYYHQGKDGNLILYVVAGSSGWKRREASKFFDELRILAHFMSGQAEEDESDLESELENEDDEEEAGSDESGSSES